ncbi:hypothetical protein AAC03nite_25580 [Alicyclobacillus acidoterrestris]|nr:hypothetical protein AAC03nite_25580 [Alicyclobacillus acidoterrestris]
MYKNAFGLKFGIEHTDRRIQLRTQFKFLVSSYGYGWNWVDALSDQTPQKEQEII